MGKRSEVDRAIAKIDADIERLQLAKQTLIGCKVAMPKRRPKPKAPELNT